MTESPQPHVSSHSGPPGANAKPPKKIHRVCIGCNNMFEVTMDNYEAKHCPACHKG